MMVVIQTTTGYDGPLNKLLKSINAHKYANKLIIVSNNANTESLSKTSLEYLYEGLEYKFNPIVIKTRKNTWEYDSYAKVQYYIKKHQLTISDKLFLFVHDTCWAKNPEEFWNALSDIETNWNHRKTNQFYYPCLNGLFNIGVCDLDFVLKFGKQFETAVFSKKTGIKIEHSCSERYNGIVDVATHITRGEGKLVRCRYQTPYSELKRRVVLLPPIALYKAFKPVYGRQKHPNIP